MSAILVSRTYTAIELLADGALYTDDGVIRRTAQKIHAWPEHGVAASTRGNSAIGRSLVSALEISLHHNDLYGAIQALSHLLKERAEQFAAAPIAELSIAGWQGSEPKSWYLITRQYGDYAPLTFYDILGRFQGGAMGSPDGAAWAALGVSDDAPDDTLRTNGVRIMEALRHLPGKVFGKDDMPAVYGVGGHVQYVRLEPNGACKNEILHEWSDTVGAKIA